MTTATDTDVFHRARQEFRVLDELTYIDVAGRAPMADRVHEALLDHLQVCRARGADKEEWSARVESLRARTAAFLGADPHEIAFMKNTSDGLNTIGAALQLAPGDTVLVSPEFEHANNVYPWMHLRDRGVQVRTVGVGPEGTVRAEDVAAAIDGSTRLVTLSAVSAWTGARPDLAAVARVVHEHGAFFLVDAAQAVGVMDMDVHRDGIDALAAATQKGLLGMYGLGVLYCRADRFDRLRPPFLSVAGVDRTGLHESDLGDFENAAVLDSAARFEVGNHNFAGLFALDASLSLLEEAGTANIERHVLTLADELTGAVVRAGATPATGTAQSGIVSFQVPDPASLVTRLDAEGVRVSLRRGRVRASLHLYNNRSDIQRLADLL
ncbi:aminotransferase class V-fold PLP-dependent enzyme [Streptomyces sp. 8L]|uniref:aminotransferase class V-fold PLP-dependent enzyme n=1 Tax=Streptomyces sp. 8L TaxID=2877242 RepID=UPI001CD4F676|nr:aminotransferase class V-fold PLP-dependent enzyme [Streptomyces sp. 8L]MCA1217033.1 aminotransferase class V-fold PLP-dependent enzyme [Streptomyces sp. 8L]